LTTAEREQDEAFLASLRRVEPILQPPNIAPAVADGIAAFPTTVPASSSTAEDRRNLLKRKEVVTLDFDGDDDDNDDGDANKSFKPRKNAKK
jgi:hypothetical protein